jgi:hypothetical protein
MRRRRERSANSISWDSLCDRHGRTVPGLDELVERAKKARGSGPPQENRADPPRERPLLEHPSWGRRRVGAIADCANSSVYEGRSGERVLLRAVSTGGWGPDDYGGYGVTSLKIQKMTANILRRFSREAFV